MSHPQLPSSPQTQHILTTQLHSTPSSLREGRISSAHKISGTHEQTHKYAENKHRARPSILLPSFFLCKAKFKTHVSESTLKDSATGQWNSTWLCRCSGPGSTSSITNSSCPSTSGNAINSKYQCTQCTATRLPWASAQVHTDTHSHSGTHWPQNNHLQRVPWCFNTENVSVFLSPKGGSVSTTSQWYKKEGNSGRLSTVEAGHTSFLYFFSVFVFVLVLVWMFVCLFLVLFYFVLRQCLTL